MNDQSVKQKIVAMGGQFVLLRSALGENTRGLSPSQTDAREKQLAEAALNIVEALFAAVIEIGADIKRLADAQERTKSIFGAPLPGPPSNLRPDTGYALSPGPGNRPLRKMPRALAQYNAMMNIYVDPDTHEQVEVF